MALTNSLKIIPCQFQILAENRHYKMANTFFSFLLSSLNINRKMTQEIGRELFFTLWSSFKFSRKNTSTKRRRSFFRFGFHLKIGLLTYLHAAPSKLKVDLHSICFSSVFVRFFKFLLLLEKVCESAFL